MHRFIYLLPLIIILSSCSGAGEVDDTFTRIVNLHASDDRSGLEEFYDEDTHHYLDQLVKFAKSNNVEQARLLGREYKLPISTLLLYHVITVPVSQRDTTNSSFASKEFLWLYMSMTGMGIYRHTSEHQIKIHESAKIYGDVAELQVAVPTGSNARLGSTYIFNREGDRWKLNFPSTMGTIEKVHIQNQRRSGLSIEEYVQMIGEQPEEEIQFQYRKYY